MGAKSGGEKLRKAEWPARILCSTGNSPLHFLSIRFKFYLPRSECNAFSPVDAKLEFAALPVDAVSPFVGGQFHRSQRRMGHPSRILEAGSGLTVSRLGVVKRYLDRGRLLWPADVSRASETEKKQTANGTPLDSRPYQIHSLRTGTTVIADA